jgi:hypothetical protein
MGAVLEHKVVDPVLIAVQGKAVSGRLEAALLDRPDDDIGSEMVEKVIHGLNPDLLYHSVS